MTLQLLHFDIVVIKLGGSVLTDADAYARCAATLGRRVAGRPTERLAVVVSAEYGATDRLQQLAESACPTPDPATLDLLWSTGELQSVAQLTLCLHQVGVPAVGLGIHQCGIEATDARDDATGIHVNPLPLLAQLHRHPVVVVPGFFARGPGDGIVSLGRGGSDLSAVLLAAGLGAAHCELIKDVPGYFSADPKADASAVPLPQISYDGALRMAAEGCDLVQPRALAAAARTQTRLVIRALADGGRETVVDDEGTRAMGTPVRRAV